MSVSVFKSAEDKSAIRDYYTRVLRAFPFEQQYVGTSFGQTFVLSAGDAGSPPVVLLHGSCSNSAFLSQELMALSANYRVYAVDIIGEAGNSDDRRPPLDTDAFPQWLSEVVDGLNLSTSAVIGNSLGAWLALKFAVTYPRRVSQLGIIAPSGLSAQNTAFLDKAAAAQKSSETLTMDAFVTGGTQLPQAVLDFINLILRGYNPITEALPVFTDDQLRKLTMPVLMIAGDKDVMVDAVSGAERLKTLLPHAEIHLIANGGHVVLNAADYILPFLERCRPS